MRTRSLLDPLLSRSVQEILVALLVEREKPWYFRDLAKRLNRTPSTLQRPLGSLVQAGIIRKWTEGSRVYFAAEPECPIIRVPRMGPRFFFRHHALEGERYRPVVPGTRHESKIRWRARVKVGGFVGDTSVDSAFCDFPERN